MSECNRPISDAHLRAIGRVAVEWSYVEWTVEDGIRALTGLDDLTTRMVTTHMSLDKRMDALLSLVSGWLPGTHLEQEIKEINKALRFERNGVPSLESRRNAVIHSHWERTNEEDFAFSALYRARGHLHFHFDRVSAAAIDAIADEIRTAGDRLFDWFGQAQHASPHKPRKLKKLPAHRLGPHPSTNLGRQPRPRGSSRE